MHCLRPLLVTLMLLRAGATEPCALSFLRRLLLLVPIKLTSTGRNRPQVGHVLQLASDLPTPGFAHFTNTLLYCASAAKSSFVCAARSSRHTTHVHPSCSNASVASDGTSSAVTFFSVTLTFLQNNVKPFV